MGLAHRRHLLALPRRQSHPSLPLEQVEWAPVALPQDPDQPPDGVVPTPATSLFWVPVIHFIPLDLRMKAPQAAPQRHRGRAPSPACTGQLTPNSWADPEVSGRWQPGWGAAGERGCPSDARHCPHDTCTSY